MAICCSSPHIITDTLPNAEDKSAKSLSYVGTAAYEVLRKRHQRYHHKLWNVTSGKVIGELHQTPSSEVFQIFRDLISGHTDWFPKKMTEIMSRTKIWCDVMSLGPPDGVFLDKMKAALQLISSNAQSKEKPVIIRIMFGNILGCPVNCGAVMKELTKELPKESNIQLWVGAWRRKASWNHAKLIAVDGKYLHTGGHNMWDPHYLQKNPVHDLSLELKGQITYDGHLFANEHWAFIKRKQSNIIGGILEKFPQSLPLLSKNRVNISEYPKNIANEFPPIFKKEFISRHEKGNYHIPLISLGRSGTLLFKKRASDDAFIAMIDAAKSVIHMAIQDFGPMCIPTTRIALPGLSWPKPYLNALARALWTRDVNIEIILSNPNSIPNNMSPFEGSYGYGWSCNDVASEIIKRIKKQFKNVQDPILRKKVKEKLQLCYIRHFDKCSTYQDGANIGLHSKHFIIDDIACYTGSQNFYDSDLAEWGVVVDDATSTKKMMTEYWTPMWDASYTGEDCDVQTVMDGLHVKRDGKKLSRMSFANQAKFEDAVRLGTRTKFSSSNTSFYGEERKYF